MRYRLRTLLIVLALGPPVLAGAWTIGKPLLASYLAPPGHMTLRRFHGGIIDDPPTTRK